MMLQLGPFRPHSSSASDFARDMLLRATMAHAFLEWANAAHPVPKKLVSASQAVAPLLQEATA
jgi:hypothetical protein